MLRSRLGLAAPLAALALGIWLGRTLPERPDARVAGPIAAGAFGLAACAPLLIGSARRRRQEEHVENVIHDLRSPVAAASGYLRFLMEEDSGPLSPDQRDLVRTALANLGRLDRFIDDSLDAACLEAGALPYRFEAVDAAPLIKDVLTQFRFAAREAGVTLACRLIPAPPPVRMDPERVRQALTNLVSNAIKFTPSGGTVLVSAARRGRGVELTVADTGTGIPAAAQAGLFQRFRRAHGAEGPRGTGLGLVIVRAVARGHGGEVALDSEPGRGSIFRFTLPLAGEEAS